MTAAATAAAAAAGVVDPAVWRVLALLMTIGAVGAILLGWRERRTLERRTRHLTGVGSSGVPDRPDPRTSAGRPSVRPWAGHGSTGRLFRHRLLRKCGLALGAAALGPAFVGGPAGWAAGAVAGWAVWWWQRRRSACRPADDAAVQTTLRATERQLPLVAELLAACLTVGSGPARAAEAVGAATGGPLGDRLARSAA
ncbi:hypothetical protein N566_05110, partial [Streptomycetaceae bacterium MP113-05]